MYHPRSPPYPVLSHQDLRSSGRSSLSPHSPSSLLRPPIRRPSPSSRTREVGVRLPGESSSPPSRSPPAPLLLPSPSGESPAKNRAAAALPSASPPRRSPPARPSPSPPGQENEYTVAEGINLGRKQRTAQRSAGPPPASGGKPLAPAPAKPPADAIANLRTKIIAREKAAQVSLQKEGFVEDLPPHQEQEPSWRLEGPYSGTQVKIHGLQAKPELSGELLREQERLVALEMADALLEEKAELLREQERLAALELQLVEGREGLSARSGVLDFEGPVGFAVPELNGHVGFRKATENSAKNVQPVADEQKVDVIKFLMSKFEPEARVELHSLLAASVKNGIRGRLVSYNTERERWLVELDDGDFFMLKPTNLRLVEVKTGDDGQLQVGQMVEFHSLMHSPHFNGSRGQLSQFDPETGCWLVTLDDGRVSALKPDNLRPVGSANYTEHDYTDIQDIPDNSYNESLLEDTRFNDELDDVIRKENDVMNRLRLLKAEQEDDKLFEYWARTPDYSFLRARIQDYILSLESTSYIPRNNALDLNSESSLSPAIVLEPKVGFSRLTLEERGVTRPVISARSTNYPLDVRAV